MSAPAASLESFLAPEELIAVLSLLGLAGAATAATLPEVEQRRARR